jgi:hypothetical protein
MLFSCPENLRKKRKRKPILMSHAVLGSKSRENLRLKKIILKKKSAT